MSRKRDGLYRRGNIFCFRWKDPKDGAWKEKSTSTADRSEAKKFKQQFETDVKADSLPTDKAEWTVEQACTKWVEQHAAHLTSHKGKLNEQSYLRQLVKRLGPTKLKGVTLDTLKDYQAKRCTEVRERVINQELTTLVNVLKEENLWRGPLLSFKWLRPAESEAGEALTAEELLRLETTAATKDNWLVAYCATVLAVNTGMRGGEIKKLRLGAIDLDNRRLKVARASTKTNAGARWVELNQAATIAMLRLYRRAQHLGATSPDHYLLPADLSHHPNLPGRGFDPTNHQTTWDTAWVKLRKAAGLPQLRFHSLRHTFISWQAEQGTPLPVTQALVGHMSASMTRHYTHISDHAARTAVQKLDELRKANNFVDVFVDVPPEVQEIGSKSVQ